MIFKELPMAGAYIIDPDKFEDERGFFVRMFAREDFGNKDLDTKIVAINNSLSTSRGTLRGIHYQIPPLAMTKIVRCIRGSVWDLALDLRPDSPTFCQWHGEELTADNRRMMYVPKGFGHAFLSLEDDSEIVYLLTADYSPVHERIARWDDPKFGVKWPIEPTVFSDKDAAAKLFDAEYHLGM